MLFYTETMKAKPLMSIFYYAMQKNRPKTHWHSKLKLQTSARNTFYHHMKYKFATHCIGGALELFDTRESRFERVQLVVPVAQMCEIDSQV